MLSRLSRSLFSLLLACGTYSNESPGEIDASVSPHSAALTTLSNSNHDLCYGPPSIEKLFDAYDGMKLILTGSYSNALPSPPVNRAYTIAEREMKNARRALDLCTANQDAAASSRYFVMAQQYALSSLTWINEATERSAEITSAQLTELLK